MTLFYRLLADFLVIFHMGWVLFVVLGQVAILTGWLLGWEWIRNFPFRVAHLTMIVIVVLESWWGITCPLTVWEKRLRDLAGQESYQGDFIANLVHDLLFFEAPRWVFTLIYSLFGAVVVGTLWLAPPRWPSRTPETPAAESAAAGSPSSDRP
jgi:polyferredoxin